MKPHREPSEDPIYPDDADPQDIEAARFAGRVEAMRLLLALLDCGNPATPGRTRTAFLSFSRAPETVIDIPLPDPLHRLQYVPQEIFQSHTHQLGASARTLE